MQEPTRPIGLYLHVPFCRRKCRYCDFYSRPPVGEEMDRFVDAVAREAAMQAPDGASVSTVYFGGGTPSMLGADRLGRLLELLGRRFRIAPGAEITVEANPLDVTEEWAEACLDAGFTRVSIGLQSVDPDQLQFLGRAHRPREGFASVRAARRAGFDNIGVDIIYGLPGWTVESAVKGVREIVSQGVPEHVSAYQLTYTEHTPLGRDLEAGAVRKLGDEEESDIYFAVFDALAEMGYESYEVSNFAKPGCRALHNANYWRHVDYLGLGPSAHSFLWPERSWNAGTLEDWFAAIGRGELPRAGSERLTADQLAAEAVMLAMRTAEGLHLGEYRRRYGRDLPADRKSVIEELAAERLVRLEGERLMPTRRGLAVADWLALELI